MHFVIRRVRNAHVLELRTRPFRSGAGVEIRKVAGRIGPCLQHSPTKPKMREVKRVRQGRCIACVQRRDMRLHHVKRCLGWRGHVSSSQSLICALCSPCLGAHRQFVKSAPTPPLSGSARQRRCHRQDHRRSACAQCVWHTWDRPATPPAPVPLQGFQNARPLRPVSSIDTSIKVPRPVFWRANKAAETAKLAAIAVP